jgi:hypothetical protein
VKARAVGLLVLLALPLAACASPESTRLRAGGRGADVGNVGRVVDMHEGSDPYAGTPRIIGAWGLQDLGPARQADRLSR